MSLIKQLWLGIFAILILALAGSFVISILTAEAYLEEQLQLKNIDNATTLALSLSHLDKDLATQELFIAAQFDSGHYQRITLLDPQDHVLIERIFPGEPAPGVPAWFLQLVDLAPHPGSAQIMDAWQTFGTLVVESHSQFAWQALWQALLDLLLWFLFATILSGLVGTLVLKYISRPLDMVVEQAEAIGQRRFVISAEPKTKEFQRLVRAMNSLSSNVKTLLEKETRQLELLRRESQQDPLTGLPNRAHFLNLLEGQLTREESESHGVVAIARVLNLSELNNKIGHAETDQVLRYIAAVIHQLSERFTGSHSGRLNGSDFALVVPGDVEVDLLAHELAQRLARQLEEYSLGTVALPLAAASYDAGESRTQVMSKLDGALAQAELKGNRAVVTLTRDTPLHHRNLNEWRNAISQALAEDKLELASFPVKAATGEIIHFEAPLRLLLDGQIQPAGYFVHWAARLGLMSAIDLEVVRRALHQLDHLQLPLAINLSAEALCAAEFREQTLGLLRAAPEKAKDLWIEFPESCALRHMADLRSFSAQLRSLGCRVGLEHVGLEFTQIRELQDIGVNYLKIDNAIVRDINNNEGNLLFLQNLCKIGHSLGFTMIAEGVKTLAEQQALIKSGIDAVTGPWVQ